MYTEPSEVNKGTDNRVYRCGSRRRHRFSRGFHTTVFQAEKYPIRACEVANMEKDYSCRNIYSLSYSEATIKALGSFKINYKLHRNCN